eukprot:m51a1_g12787 hypothetical protein (152) ;mRNA; f:985-3492
MKTFNILGTIVLKWQQGSLTTQVVLTQQGDIYYLYSGSWSGIAPVASVSTGTFGGITWSSVPNGFGGQWALENPAEGEEGGLAAPTKQYSFIEVYDFNLVSMEGAQELAFAGESAQVNLLWKVPFGGKNYDKMFVSQKVRTAYAGSLEELQ